ncbi:cadherin-19 isoform X2 [Cyrtonyx montezumae]|uniref:cadherin-19 isoform X2 n=1 Tax=Cyrtonyx montezumae TaxID=9017 RepID=UPI0032D9CC9B
MNCSTYLSLVLALVQLQPCSPTMQNYSAQKTDKSFRTIPRLKRDWVWEPLFVTEEETSMMPMYVGQLKSDLDKDDGSLQYILTGEGADSIFFINEHGKIYVRQKLDREKKSFYILRAQVINRKTRLPIEPDSEFIIKVRDINDHEPQFLDGPYVATVPEMSPEGTSVTQVTATDGDDPSYGNNARLLYSLVQGQPYFSVEPKTGVIRMASQMDRETKDQYLVVIQAKDMVGQPGAFSATTTVTINLSDVNDNPPKFEQRLYYMNVSEEAPVGTTVGRLLAEDSDTGDNAAMNYFIEEDSSNVFDIITNNETQEGIILLKKRVDYESKRKHIFRVKVVNRYIDDRFLEEGPFEDKTIVQVSVINADEPPVFTLESYVMEIAEGVLSGSLVGIVSARDVDKDNSPVRYSIVQGMHLKRLFSINEHNGTIITTEPLDREKASWHNITVTATETNNTAGIFTTVSGFSRQEQFYFFLPIIILDNGSPPLTSTNTLTVTVCDCDTEVNTLYCRYGAFMYSMGLSTEALVAALACLLILLVFFLAIIGIRQQRKKTHFSEKVEEFRENIVRYDDEGGGEEDTDAFDISALRTRTVLRTHKPRKKITTEIHSLYRQSLQVGPDSAIFRQFISEKLEEANTDPTAPPYDSLQTYAFEGTGSLAGSLSSIDSNTSDVDQNYDYLVGWGPRFKLLASMYASQSCSRD